MLNSLGREIPEFIEGIGKLEPFQGALTKLRKGWMDEPTIPAPNKAYLPHQSKVCKTLEEAIIRSNPHNGMTVSSIITFGMVIFCLFRRLRFFIIWESVILHSLLLH